MELKDRATESPASGVLILRFTLCELSVMRALIICISILTIYAREINA